MQEKGDLEFLKTRLIGTYGEALQKEIFEGYGTTRPVFFRVNTLKTDKERAKKALDEAGIAYSGVDWYENAFYAETDENALRKLPLYANGEIYLQSFSSMLPPLFLEARAGDCVLDMTAAPGGKTTEISVLSGGTALVTACEKDGVRFGRLKYNIEKQGAPNVTLLHTDAAKLDEFFRFDKILLDAPCSGSGTISFPDFTFSQKLVAGCVKTQKTLFEKALSLLKKGGTLVYSTCSVLKEENEEIILPAIKSRRAELVSIEGEGLPLLPSLSGTFTLRPTRFYEGFFVAKLRKM